MVHVVALERLDLSGIDPERRGRDVSNMPEVVSASEQRAARDIDSRAIER